MINGVPHYTNKGAWVEGSLTVSYDGSICTISGRQSVYTVHKETVGQYIGLKDKNGTKIFEGDIIEEGYNNMADRWVTKRYEVKWNNIQLCWMCYDGNNPYPTEMKVVCTNGNVIEVVGNIYDNKKY